MLTRAAQLVAHTMRLTAFMPVSDIPAISCVEMPEIAGEPVTPPVRDSTASWTS